jgi:hypothetical protein
MRRICASVLVAVFSLQTTASAASPGEIQGPNVQPLLSAIEGSQVFALLTGQEARYEAMHASRPQIVHIRPDGYRPDVSRARFAYAVVRYGEPGKAPLMTHKIPLAKDAPRDPLAMQRPVAVSPVAMHGSACARHWLIRSALTMATGTERTLGPTPTRAAS